MELPRGVQTGHTLWRGLKGLDLPVLALAMAVIGAPLLLGGVHLVTQTALSAVALVGFIALTFRLRARKQKLRLGLVGIGFFLALALTLLQWLPLPMGLVEWLSPESADARMKAAELVGADAPSFAPLSLDGSRTALAFILLLGYLSVYLIAANLNDHLNRFRLVGSFIQWAGLGVVLVGMVHTLLGETQIFGVYTASVDLSDQLFLTTFVNPNHAAALMLFAGCISFGFWASSRDPVATKFHLIATLILSLGVCATGSRACMALLAIALAGTVGWVNFAKVEGEVKERTTRGGLVLALGLGAALLIFGSPRFLAELVGAGDWQEIILGDQIVGRWDVGATVASEYLGLGVGHGAFAVASSQVMGSWQGGLVSYAHNFVLQAVADWGLAMTVIIGAFLLGGGFGALRHTKWRPEVVGVAVGVSCLVLQNLVDFSFLIPGVGMAAMAAAGFFVGRAIQGVEGRKDGQGIWSRPRFHWHHGYSVVWVALFTLCAVHAFAQSPEHWSERARQALDEKKPGALPIDVMVTEHPRDFHIFALAAYVAEAAEKDKLALKLLDRAIDLAPHAHQALKRRAEHALRRGQMRQSLPFLASLASEGHEGKRTAVRLVLKHANLKGLADAFFSQDENSVRLGVELLRQKDRMDVVEHLLAWSVSVFPDSTWIREELAAIWVYKPGKEDALDTLSIKMLAQSTQVTSGDKSKQLRRTGYMIQGYLLKRQGRFTEAWHMFKEAAQLDPERSVRPLLESGSMLVEMGDEKELAELLETLKEKVGDEPLVRGPYHALRSRAEEAKGRIRYAINEMQRAVLFLKHQASYYERLADLYESIGDGVSAKNVRERLAQNVDAQP